jgi:hypothetical protein
MLRQIWLLVLLALMTEGIHVASRAVDDAWLWNSVVLHVCVHVFKSFLALWLILLMFHLIDILRMANILCQILYFSSKFPMGLV